MRTTRGLSRLSTETSNQVNNRAVLFSLDFSGNSSPSLKKPKKATADIAHSTFLCGCEDPSNASRMRRRIGTVIRRRIRVVGPFSRRAPPELASGPVVVTPWGLATRVIAACSVQPRGTPEGPSLHQLNRLRSST